jgi:hypothetical protein
VLKFRVILPWLLDAFFFDFFAQRLYPVKQGLGPWRTSGYIYVDRDDFIVSRNYGLGIAKNAAAYGAGSHGDDPLGFGHLFVKPLYLRRHFPGESSGAYQKISLPGGGAQHFHTEPGNVKTG